MFKKQHRPRLQPRPLQQHPQTRPQHQGPPLTAPCCVRTVSPVTILENVAQVNIARVLLMEEESLVNVRRTFISAQNREIVLISMEKNVMEAPLIVVMKKIQKDTFICRN